LCLICYLLQNWEIVRGSSAEAEDSETLELALSGDFSSYRKLGLSLPSLCLFLYVVAENMKQRWIPHLAMIGCHMPSRRRSPYCANKALDGLEA
jgi:hypothetical protein